MLRRENLSPTITIDVACREQMKNKLLELSKDKNVNHVIAKIGGNVAQELYRHHYPVSLKVFKSDDGVGALVATTVNVPLDSYTPLGAVFLDNVTIKDSSIITHVRVYEGNEVLDTYGPFNGGAYWRSL